jgi:hypothetical protein
MVHVLSSHGHLFSCASAVRTGALPELRERMCAHPRARSARAHGRLPSPSCGNACPRTPRAAVCDRPLRHGEAAASACSCGSTRQLVSRAVSLARPLKHGQAPFLSRSLTGGARVPRGMSIVSLSYARSYASMFTLRARLLVTVNTPSTRAARGRAAMAPVVE